VQINQTVSIKSASNHFNSQTRSKQVMTIRSFLSIQSRSDQELQR